GIRDKLVTGVQTCALPIYLNTKVAWNDFSRCQGAVGRARRIVSTVAYTGTLFPLTPGPTAVELRPPLPGPLLQRRRGRLPHPFRSEERRVGKGARAGGASA